MSEKQKVMDISELFIQDDEIIENKNAEPTELKITDLVPFNNHPFKLYEGARLDDMVESIKEYGIILPLIVRPIENEKYEILSGHNRANAGRIAGLEKVPVVIKEDLTDEEAMLIVTETNVHQRALSELSHSEKARILTERHNAIKNQGKRQDLINEIEMMSNIDGYEENLTSVQIEQKLESREKVAGSYDLSPSTVARYLRIDVLIDELKIRLDNNEIPLMGGVDLSYLKEKEQEDVETLLDKGYKINLKKADALKTFSRGRNFTYEKAENVLSGEYFKKKKPKKAPKLSATFNKKLMGRFEDEEIGIKDIEKLILELIDEYLINRRKNKEK